MDSILSQALGDEAHLLFSFLTLLVCIVILAVGSRILRNSRRALHLAERRMQYLQEEKERLAGLQEERQRLQEALERLLHPDFAQEHREPQGAQPPAGSSEQKKLQVPEGQGPTVDRL